MPHQNFADLATRLIEKNGQVSQIVTITNSGTSYNPTQTKSYTDVIAVNTKINQSEVDGDLVKRDDLFFLIDSKIEPLKSDKFTFDGREYEIKNIVKLKPADTTILYKIQVRL